MFSSWLLQNLCQQFPLQTFCFSGFPHRDLESNQTLDNLLHSVKTQGADRILIVKIYNSGVTVFYFVVSRRSKSLALHAVRSRSINSDTGEDGEGLEPSPDNVFSNTAVNSHSENQEALASERKMTGDGSVPITAALDRGVKEAERSQSREKEGENEEHEEADRLFIHLRDNMETIREFCKDMAQQIPTPEQCVIEGNVNITGWQTGLSVHVVF